jgi:hypothetical protein
LPICNELRSSAEAFCGGFLRRAWSPQPKRRKTPLPFTYDYFGKVATFDDQQAIVVQALAGGFREQFREALMTGVALEEAETKYCIS